MWQDERKMGFAGETELKKVLFLSYYFPPIGMGGTQRPAKFAKYLSGFGWEPTVISVLPISYWANDETALDELKHVRIIRSESWDPQRLLAKMGRKQSATVAGGRGLAQWINQKVLPFFILPDTKILWKKHCVQTVSQLLEKEQFDAIFSTSPPHSVHLIAQKLSQKYNIPWIADFRDSWAHGVVVHEPTFIQKKINLCQQKKVLRNANAVTAVTPGISQELAKSTSLEKKISYLPNGFDSSDFKDLGGPKNNKFVFCHIGSITQYSHPKILLKAFADLIKEQPELKQKLVLQFVGQNLIGNFNDLLLKYNLKELVEQTGYVSHRESVKKLINADALVLIAQGKKGAHFIPGKAFEYIGASKPILAITNVSDTIDLLKDYSLATTASPSDGLAIKNAIQAIISSKPIPDKKNIDFQKTFDRKIQTKQLAEILNSITSTR
jgi:glycosyltransferase involved in cell wall biosynthesis